MSIFNNIFKGKQGENIAEQYLKELGYKIIERNWHYSKNAEIDIIAEDKGTLVFIEVKTRTTLEYGHPFESITKSKIEKIYKANFAYLKECNKDYKNFRFDGISILGLKEPKIEHIKNIGQF